MVNTLLVITLVSSILMFNLHLLEENFSIATQASVIAVEKLFNLDMPVLAVTEDEKHTDNYSCITFGLCSNSEECPLCMIPLSF